MQSLHVSTHYPTDFSFDMILKIQYILLHHRSKNYLIHSKKEIPPSKGFPTILTKSTPQFPQKKTLVLIFSKFLWQNYSIFNSTRTLGLNITKPSQCILKGFPMLPIARWGWSPWSGRSQHEKQNKQTTFLNINIQFFLLNFLKNLLLSLNA